MPVLCGNCGGRHATVAEVRACHDDGTTAIVEPAPEVNAPEGPAAPPSPPERPTRPTGRRPTTPTSADGRAARRGPSALGRSLVITPGQQVPADWAEARRVVIDDSVIGQPADVIVELGRHWAERRPVVVELAAALDRHPDETDEREPWRLDPSFVFPLERLAHLLWSNATDLREATAPRTEVIASARAAGATPVAEAADPGAVGSADPAVADLTPDVVVTEGGAWCDGGPLDLELGRTIDAPVVHATWVEHGALTPVTNPPPTAELAADQLAAVTHRGGPCRVISPAGSGKTRTLTERARHLVANCGLPPSALTLVAYNNRAAAEMRDRLQGLGRLQIRTLNALGLAIVGGTGPFTRQAPDARPPRVIDERAVRDHLERLVQFPRRANTDPAAAWIEALGQIRLGLRSPDEVEAEYQGDVDGLAEVFPRYREALRRNDEVDFDEQIYQALEVLLREPEARRAAQRSCRVMLVDEFQDLTPAHLLLIRLLAAPAYDVFGVGDDDQTIYGYQGADPRWLIDFATYFPGAADHPLTVNYRCPPATITAARNLLTRNGRRVPKTIDAPAGRPVDDRAVQVRLTEDGTVGETVATIRSLLAGAPAAVSVPGPHDPFDDPGTFQDAPGGAAPRDIVVLARVNAALAPVQVALTVAGIPVDPLPGIGGWLNRTGVRAALAWLDLALTPDRLEPATVREAARRPPRGLSPKLLEWMGEQRDLGGLERLAGRLGRERDQEKLLGFVADVRRLAGAVGVLAGAGAGGTTADAMAMIRDRIGLGGAVESLDRSRGRVDRSTHGDDFDALFQLATLHPEPRTFRAWLREQLAVELPAGEGGRVHLSTVHRVKGLEWPHVVVHEASARLSPHRLADDVEEERRIFHVALTRCSASVTIVAPADEPSPFVAELAAPGQAPAATAKMRATKPPPGQPSPPDPPVDLAEWKTGQALNEALRQWRRDRATADGVPAYVVFADRTLDDLVRRRPTTFTELRACHGIGPAKADNYGDDILAVIAEHLE